jgi:hypothetical protein
MGGSTRNRRSQWFLVDLPEMMCAIIGNDAVFGPQGQFLSSADIRRASIGTPDAGPDAAARARNGPHLLHGQQESVFGTCPEDAFLI